MLRVAVILETLPGASETFLETLLGNLREAGFQVNVWVRSGAKLVRPDCFGPVRCFPSERKPRLPRGIHAVFMGMRVAVRSPSEALRAGRLLWSSEGCFSKWIAGIYRLAPLLLVRSDVVYFAFGGLAARYCEYFQLRTNGVFSLRGADIFIDPLGNSAYRNRLRAALQHAAGIHCVCQAARQQAEQLAGRPLPRAAVIHTALSPAFVSEMAPTDKEESPVARVLSVSRLHWKKGLEHGMRAFRELIDRGVDAEWEIIGEGPHRIALEWAIRDEGLSTRVFLRGAQSASEVRQALRRSDILFQPSVSEGISNAVIEAMAFGLAAVTTAVDGMPEALEHGRHGLLVAPRDWRAMADALELLARDKRQRRQIGWNARQHALKDFTSLRQQDCFRALFAAASRAA